VQPKPPALALLKVILHVHAHDRAHPGERVNHHPDHGAIAQTSYRIDVHTVKQYSRFFGAEHRRAAGLDDMLRSPHRVSRVARQHLPGNQIVKQHPQGSQMLLDGGFGVVLPQLLNISRNGDRGQLGQGQVVRVTPTRELRGGASVSNPRVVISDVGGEELDEAPNGIASSIGKQCGHAPGGGLKGSC
jgi:hypothetical protein